MGKPVTIGITDLPTASAIRELERGQDELALNISALEDRVDGISVGAGSVTSVTGSAPVFVSPTTGDVIVSVDLSGKADVVHGHSIADVTGLQAAIDGKAPLVHGHAISDVTGLQTALDSKLPLTNVSGTLNRVAKFTGANAVGDSSITDTGSLVTVANPATITGALTLGTMTAGSVLFAGASGVVSQDNTAFFWNDTDNRLDITTGGSSNAINAVSSGSGGQIGLRNTGASGLADIYMLDTASVVKAAFGYGNVSYAQAERADKTYVWRDGSFAVVRTGATDLTVTSAGDTVVGATGLTKAFSGPFEATKNGASEIVCSAYGTGVNAQLKMFSGRGTGAATTALQSGDTIGAIAFAGALDATNQYASVLINARTTQALSSTQRGAELEFYTSPNGSTGRLLRLTIENDGALSMANSATAAVSAANELRLRYNTTGHVLQVSANGGAYATISTGVGTANRITKWSNTTGALTDSIVTDNGTTVSVAGALSTTGNCTLGDSTADTHTINGRATITGQANQHSLVVNNALTGQTSSINGVRAELTGSFDATAGTRACVAAAGIASSTRSAGANDLTNYGLYGDALNGQVNYALFTDRGDVRLNATSGSTTINGATTINNTLTQAGVHGANFGALVCGVALIDSTAAAAGVGAGIRLNGAYTGSSTTIGAAIKTLKANGTDGNFEFDLVLGARAHGSSDVAEVLRLFGAGGARITGNVQLGDTAADSHVVNGTLDVRDWLKADFITQSDGLSGIYVDTSAGVSKVTLETDTLVVGDPAATGAGTAIIRGAIYNTREFVAPQITANQDDYNPTDSGVQWQDAQSSILYVNSDAARDITGLAFGTGWTGRHVWIYNTGAFNITLKHQSGSSTAGKRFQGVNNADVVLQPHEGRHLYYSSNVSDWIFLR